MKRMKIKKNLITPSKLIEKKINNSLPESLKKEPNIIKFLNSKQISSKISSKGKDLNSSKY